MTWERLLGCVDIKIKINSTIFVHKNEIFDAKGINFS